MEASISRVAPAAQQAVSEAAAVYQRHTGRWLVGMLVHGSAYKGGYIPGCSDIDFQLYLDPAAIAPDGALPLDLLLAIHRDLANIDCAPFRYIQCYALPCATPPGQVPPIPGAYTLISGVLPVPEATSEELIASARASLAQIEPVSHSLASELLSCGGRRLQHKTRLLCTEVWPTLYHIAALQQDDPIAIWNLRKADVIALLPDDTPAGSAIRAFHDAMSDYYPAEATVEGRLAVIASGIAFLAAAKAWWAEQNR